MMKLMFSLALSAAYVCQDIVSASSRTQPPSGAVVVRVGTTTSGEFQTVSAAVNSLPNDNSAKIIFIYPGTYTEQVSITQGGPLTIFGYTTDSSNYKANTVTIKYGSSLIAAGSDDASATLRVHEDDFRMYNVIVSNTFGRGAQALALSQFGNRVGFYACAFYGFQDTMQVEQGAQVYLRGYIEGAVDFIFGRQGQAYFENNMIAVSSPGFVTANGRYSNDNTSYVFNNNTISLAPWADSGTAGGVFLGRPWQQFAKVIFKHTVITAPLNDTVWSIWDQNQPNTENVFFAEYNSLGGGIERAQRPSFSKVLTSEEAQAYSISSAVGSDFATWVDTSYLA